MESSLAGLMDIWQWYGILGLSIGLFALTYMGYRLEKRQDKLERFWEEFKRQRQELFAAMADPDVIEQQMERSAQMRDNLDAKLRERMRDAEKTPAKIHTPMPSSSLLRDNEHRLGRGKSE